MNPLRLPIRNRRDLCIVQFPGDCDVDERAAALAEKMMRNHPSASPPPIRVVPLEDRGAYDEALALVMEKLATETMAAWLTDRDRALFSYRVQTPLDGVVETTNSIRILQVLFN